MRGDVALGVHGAQLLALGARAPRARSQPNQPRASSSRSIATIRAGALGMARRCRARATTGGEAGRRAQPRGTVPAHGRSRPHRRRPRRRGRRRRRPLRRAVRRPRGRARDARLGPPLAETASYWAQGGLAAALAVDDSPELPPRGHDRRRPRPRAPRAPPRVLAARRRARVRDLEELGVRFDADRHGDLALGPRGRPPRRRVAHAGGSATGRRILRQLSAVVVEHAGDRGPRGRRARAARGRATAAASASCCEDGRAIRARAVILATGGAAALWSRTTNPPGSSAPACCSPARPAPRWPTSSSSSSTRPPSTGMHRPRGLPGHRGDARRGRDAARRARRALRRRARAARRGGAGDLVDAGASSGRGASTSTCARSTPRASPTSSTRCARPASTRARAGAGRPREPLRHGRDRHRSRRRARPWPASTPSASAPAPGCTAPTGWPRTRSRSASSSAAAPRSPRLASRPRPGAAEPAGAGAADRPPARRARRCGARRPRARRRGPQRAARRSASARPARRRLRARPRGEPRRAHRATDFPATDPALDGHHTVLARRGRRAGLRALGLTLPARSRQRSTPALQRELNNGAF